GLAVTASDNCSAEPVRLQVFSDEEEGALADASQTPRGDLQLRAERDIGGGGRVYLILVTARDAAGNRSFTCRTVVVPRSKAPGDQTSVNAAAAAARSFSEENDGAVPPGYSSILDTDPG